jgi:hypothetical protein
MATATLHDFIGTHRKELIARCRAKVATRSSPPVSAAEIDEGVPLFLDQLMLELRDGPSKSGAIMRGASTHGASLRVRGFTVSQVVHDYGDICQAVTDLAVELAAPIDTEDFRTFNRCLDDAIASAVTEYSREPSGGPDDDIGETRRLVRTACSAWEAIKAGRVGARGTTGQVLDSSLNALSAILDGPGAAAPSGKQ